MVLTPANSLVLATGLEDGDVSGELQRSPALLEPPGLFVGVLRGWSAKKTGWPTIMITTLAETQTVHYAPHNLELTTLTHCKYVLKHIGSWQQICSRNLELELRTTLTHCKTKNLFFANWNTNPV